MRTLFKEIIRIAEVKKPKYMLLENVKGLTCKKFKDTFNKILSELDRIGYNVYWKVLNSKDFGIPQSRARVWFVCFRKDIDNKTFKFPEPTELKIFIKDILEQEIDHKYYLSEKLQERFAKYLEDKNRIVNLQPRQGKGIGGKGIISKADGTTYCLDSENNQGIVSVQLDSSGKGYNSQNDRIYDSNGVMTSIPSNGASNKCNVFTLHRANEIREYSEESPTLKTAMGTGGNNVPMVAISNSSPRECGFKEDVCPTILSRDYKDPKIVKQGMLRKLTPKECFRLMGFLNDEINLKGLSDTQCYKLVGNGQDVNVVERIFKEMFKQLEDKQ